MNNDYLEKVLSFLNKELQKTKKRALALFSRLGVKKKIHARVFKECFVKENQEMEEKGLGLKWRKRLRNYQSPFAVQEN